MHPGRQHLAAPERGKALVERLDAQAPIPIHIEAATGDLSLSEDAALTIYRIAQEAIHNAIQHGDSSEIAVRLTQYPDKLRMTITDDGRGIPESKDLRSFVAQGHFGLAGMRERAAMIGGMLDVHSAPDYGTAVILEIPAWPPGLAPGQVCAALFSKHTERELAWWDTKPAPIDESDRRRTIESSRKLKPLQEASFLEDCPIITWFLYKIRPLVGLQCSSI